MKKRMKILSFALIVMSILLMATVFASYDKLKGFTPSDQGTGAMNTVQVILGFVQFVGYAIAVGMLIYVGIKYVMASADEKANLKNALVRYVIGAVLIAGASAVSGWIFGLGEKL